MKSEIRIRVDTDELRALEDSYLAALWHGAQANPASLNDRDAERVAESIGCEIIAHWLAATPPLLWARQGGQAEWFQKIAGQPAATPGENA